MNRQNVEDLNTCCDVEIMCTNCHYYDFKERVCSITKEKRSRLSDICENFKEQTDEEKEVYKDEIEDIAQTYWEFVQNLYYSSDAKDFFWNGRLYGIDRQRRELHQRLCYSWGFEHDDKDLLEITNNLDLYDLDEFIQKLYEFKKRTKST